MKKLFFTIITSLIVNFTTFAQDTYEGFYVDGVKCSELSCTTFGDLEIKFKWDKKWEELDAMTLYVEDFIGLSGASKKIDARPEHVHAVILINMTELRFKNIEDGYFVYKIFKKDVEHTDGYNKFDNNSGYGYSKIGTPSRTRLNAKKKSGHCLLVSIYGNKQDGFTEYLSTDGTIKRSPKYSGFPIFDKFFVFKFIESAPCSLLGSTEEFSNNVNQTTSGQKLTSPALNNSNVDTSNLSSQILKFSNFKPLDKKKPGYFVEKNSDNIVTREGYKNKNKSEDGELRLYNDKGIISEIYTFSNGKQNGAYSKFDETGNLLQSGNYKNGEKDGEWKRYKNGKIVGMDVYVDGSKQ